MAQERVSQPRDRRITDADRSGVRGSDLAERIGLTDHEIQWRKDFTGFGHRDVERLTAMEAGDGFAVVANEIKRLAGDSQDHANQIEETVREIQTETVESIESLEQITTQVNDGVSQVETST